MNYAARSRHVSFETTRHPTGICEVASLVATHCVNEAKLLIL